MPFTIIEDVKGSDLPEAWTKKMQVAPDRIYRVIIQPQEEYQSLREIMARISRNAKSRGMTPDILEDILGERIKHIL
ncbi:MAG: hypothetical protein JRJ03_03350 [Deltaproteobacteria bacterium]|nr:hypothetical protein [Deltaproteobacteria bacterium]